MKLELNKELKRLDWYEQRIEMVNDDLYSISNTLDVNEVKEAIQRNVDQGATENLQDLPQYAGAECPWVVVNGVVRRYGYSR